MALRIWSLAGAVALGASLTLSGGQAAAQGVSFAGKTIEIWVGASAGGGYDVVARAVGRYLPDYVEGKPTILPKNLPGGGSVRATNAVYHTAPKDGTVIGAPSRAVMTMPLVGVEAANFEPTKMHWVGSVSSEDYTCIAWHTSGIKTLADAQKNKLIVGTSGPGTSSHTYALMMQNLFGAKFEIIRGYQDNTSARLALERGEVLGTCGSLSVLKNMKVEWTRDKQINFLVLFSPSRAPDLPDVPTALELVTGEGLGVVKVALAPLAAGRPLFLPPGVPMDRVTTLRRAFDAVVKDRRFIEDAKKMGFDVSPMSGEQVNKMLDEVYALPPAVVEKAKEYLESR